MTPHSANELTTNPYLGTTLINGVLCHRWFDGTVIQILAGGAGDDDGDGDGDGADDDADGDDDGDKDGDDGDDDDDDKTKGKKKSGKKIDDDDDDDDKGKTPSERRAWRQAADRRIKLRTANATIGERDTEIVALKAEVADLKKNGAGDDKLKGSLAKAEKERDDALAEVKTMKATIADTAVTAEIEEIVKELNITQSVKMVKGLLQVEGKLKIGDDGEVEEDLTRSIKRFIKNGELNVKKKSASGDEDEDEDESGAPSRSSGSPMRRGGGVRTVPTEKQLAKKYPALQR